MTLSELREACQDIIDDGHEALVLEIQRRPTGNGMRLLGKRRPVGEVLCVNGKGHSVVRFKAAGVIKYLDGLNHG